MLTLLFASALSLLPVPSKIVERTGTCAVTNVTFVEDASLPREGYRLEISKDGVTVASSSAAGRFYAGRTLAQLPRPYPCLSIEDAPKYAWRGVLLDDSRHFFGKETVKKTIDLMSRYKLNVFHWHFTDDNGWRLELKRHPEVHLRGSVRPSSMPHGATEEHPAQNGEKYGPYFYTQDDVREILAYAAERHVTVVPEIDLPAHSLALFVSHPEFTCRPEDPVLKAPWMTIGPQYQCFCAANEEGMRFLEDVLDEVCTLFPSESIHIGGDECPPNNWRGCPKCQALMKRLGLKDESELQSRITRRFSEFLAKRGRKAVAWDETLGAAMPKNLTLQLWRDPKDGRKAAAAGTDVIMSPADWAYFSQPQGIPDDPFQHYSPQTITLEKAYAFDPAPGWGERERRHVVGIESCNWGEMTWNAYDLGWKMWPRTFATAEIGWSGPKARPYDDFARRAAVHRNKLLKEYVNPAPVPVSRSFTFASWNVGHFALGLSHASTIPAAAAEAKGREFRKFLSEVNADILGVCEFSEAFATNGAMPSAQAVFAGYDRAIVGPSHFYQWNAQFVRTGTVLGTRVHEYQTHAQGVYWLETRVKIGGEEVVFVETHLDWCSQEVRSTQMRELVERFKDVPRVVIAGDFNQGIRYLDHSKPDVDNPVEYQVFADAGFTLGNDGRYKTHPPEKPFKSLDNIIVKGLKLRNFRVWPRWDLSDHALVSAELEL